MLEVAIAVLVGDHAAATRRFGAPRSARLDSKLQRAWTDAHGEGEGRVLARSPCASWTGGLARGGAVRRHAGQVQALLRHISGL